MHRALAIVLSLGGCGPSVADRCVEVEWVRALEEADRPCDVAVRADGTIGVLSPSAVLELDERGDTIAARELTTHGGESLRHCRDLHADVQDRWWLTGTVDGDEVERYPWLFRFGVDGTPEARLLPVEGEHYLGPMVGWNDGVLVGGFATHEDPQAEKRRLAIALGVDASLEVVDAWASTPELGSVATLLDVGGTLLVLAKPPSLDYADAVLIRLDALDRRPAWTRTIGVLGSASPNEIIAAAAARRHALFLSAATELDPDAPPSGPRPGGLPLIPPTRLRWSIDAWTVEGDLAWRHDLTTDHDGTGTVAASEDVILTWLGSRAPTEDEPSMLFAMDSDGHCICEQLTTLSGSVALAAAPTLGPDTFLVLGETEDETLGAQTWLARLHVVR